MKLKFADNYNYGLFVIYLILNLCGYDDENNKEGMHPVRIMVRNEFRKYNRESKKFLLAMKELMKKVYYSRLTHVFVLTKEGYKKKKKDMYKGYLEDEKEIKRVMPLIEKFEEKYKLRKFFKEKYLPYVRKITNSRTNIKFLKKCKENIGEFLKLRKCEVSIVINLMEAYWRGHSYFASKNEAILNVGPDNKNGGVNWHNITHEALHFLLRRDFLKVARDFSPRITEIIREKTKDVDYRDSPSMYRVEETFIRAFTPLIMNENRPGYWDYLKDRFPLSEPIYKALKSIRRKKKSRVLLFSARGKTLTQKDLRRLKKYEQLILICGRYEGVDNRVAEHLADEEISIGNYVLTGGEIPAMVLVDGITRLLPGVLGNLESPKDESFAKENELEYPQYTKPERFRSWKVPKVLLSGNHGNIKEWRDKQKKAL